MSLPGRWHPKLWRRALSVDAGREARLEVPPASGLDDLQKRLSHWSHLWTHEDAPDGSSEAQQLVAERLARWIERCFGQHVQDSLRDKGSQISLATSTPIFTAFLGRRATRELSRRVLQDI